jgi:putative FmdB family regulatory protein
MPLFTLECETCNEKHEKIVSYAKKDEQTCPVCGNVLKHKPTFLTVSHGLPNGFSSNRRPPKKEVK